MFIWNSFSVYLELHFCISETSFLFTCNFIFVYLEFRFCLPGISFFLLGTSFLFVWNFISVYLELHFCLLGTSFLFAWNFISVYLELHFCLPETSFLFTWNFILFTWNFDPCTRLTTVEAVVFFQRISDKQLTQISKLTHLENYILGFMQCLGNSGCLSANSDACYCNTFLFTWNFISVYMEPHFCLLGT